MPTLRIGQSDLKCKNGCDYYGNPQWQGYCSKCHREQMQRQRKAEKATISTLPKPDYKKPDKNVKLASHSSFSKFEEKRLRQSETLKRANILKFNVFKKSNTTEDHEQPREKKSQDFKIPAVVNERLKRDIRIRFPSLGSSADRDCRAFVHSFILDVIKCAPAMGVDELSERVQRQYQRFLKHMDTSSHFSTVDSDTKEMLIDFIEKHTMSYLHDLPSVMFSPAGTDDERLDRAMSERIQQLSWVGEKHLDCKLDRSDLTCSKLLYKAISEFLGMDASRWPGGKLARAHRGCTHVVAMCAAAAHTPPSADDLLPALIFTILKANPPRLISNINYVTRFCHAPRLMTGEAGYYFTNLCCAVSFIENLTAESLSMDKKEFDCYMAMPASIGGSAWAAALSLCAEMSEAEEQRNLALELLSGARDIGARAGDLANSAVSFEEEISKKVQDVLNKTSLEIKPRREIPPLRKIKEFAHKILDFNSNSASTDNQVQQNNCVDDKAEKHSESIPEQNTQEIIKGKPKILILQTSNVTSKEFSQEETNNSDADKTFKESNSLELLTPSPLGFTSFGSRSIDDLMSPDEYNPDSLVPGLSAVNYDIDLSDLSGDNSVADDKCINLENRDPFSPEGIVSSQRSKEHDPFDLISNVFNQFSLSEVERKDHFDPFSVTPSANDPFHPKVTQSNENIKEMMVGLSFEYDFNSVGSSIINSKEVHRVNESNVSVDPFSPINNKPLDFEQIEKSFDMKASSAVSNLNSNIDPFIPMNTRSENRPYVNQSNVEIGSDDPVSLLDSSPNTLLLPTPLQPQSNSKT